MTEPHKYEPWLDEAKKPDEYIFRNVGDEVAGRIIEVDGNVLTIETDDGVIVGILIRRRNREAEE